MGCFLSILWPSPQREYLSKKETHTQSPPFENHPPPPKKKKKTNKHGFPLVFIQNNTKNRTLRPLQWNPPRRWMQEIGGCKRWPLLLTPNSRVGLTSLLQPVQTHDGSNDIRLVSLLRSGFPNPCFFTHTQSSSAQHPWTFSANSMVVKLHIILALPHETRLLRGSSLLDGAVMWWNRRCFVLAVAGLTRFSTGRKVTGLSRWVRLLRT